MTGISTETAQRLLETALPDNDAKATTVRGWLAALLRAAWIKREVFKRPFGWSGAWEDDIYRALIAAGIIAGELDEDGDLSRDFDYDAADQVILAAIEAMAVPGGAGAPVSGSLRCAHCQDDGAAQGRRDEVLAAIGKFESDLGFTAPELTGMRIDQLRGMVRGIFEDDDGCVDARTAAIEDEEDDEFTRDAASLDSDLSEDM
jgi:hypothetical protein